jgi:protein MAK16
MHHAFCFLNCYLSRNYGKALEQLDEHLAYFPKAQIHHNKQRLTKIHQYLLRMRKLKLRQINGRAAKFTRVHRKVEQREERREKKALVAAKIENSIEKELMERLAKGTYGDIYNFPEVSYQKALEGMEEENEEEVESEEELETEDGEFVFLRLMFLRLSCCVCLELKCVCVLSLCCC